MKKIIIWLIIILLIASFIVYKARNVIVKSILESSCRSLTNLKLTLEDVDINIAKHSIAAGNLKLYNPPGFEKATMVNIPSIYIDYNPAAVLQHKVHFHVLRIDLKELLIIRNQKGHLNFMSIKALKAPRPVGKKKDFKIDKLYLSIDRVIYRDYKSQPPAVKIFNINLRNQLFENVDDPKVLVSTIIHKALIKTKIYELLNFNINILRENLKDVIDKGGVIIKDFPERVSQKTKEAAKDIQKTIKDMFIKEKE